LPQRHNTPRRSADIMAMKMTTPILTLPRAIACGWASTQVVQ
jgi:hypothetical protein